MEKLCVTIDKTAGAMEALRRALHALDTAHLGEKARADACRALREHEMAALREAADELEELVPQTYWPMPDYCELLSMCPTCTYTYAYRLMESPRNVANKHYCELLFDL